MVGSDAGHFVLAGPLGECTEPEAVWYPKFRWLFENCDDTATDNYDWKIEEEEGNGEGSSVDAL